MRNTARLLTPHARAFSLSRIFILNLDRRPDRWAAITRTCANRGLPRDLVERVPAVEGTAVDVEACYRCGFISRLGLMRLREPPAHHIWGMDLNAGALGCALSHIQLWSRIAALSTPTAQQATALTSPVKECCLILEDDAELVGSEGPASSSPSRPLLEELQLRMHGRVPRDWEVLYLGGLDTAGQCASVSVAEGVARVPQYHRTTGAYLLTPQGARRLLATCLPLTFQLDTVMTMRVGLPPGLPALPGAVPYVLDPVTYTLQPPLLRQSAQLGTDIQQ